MYTQSQQQQQQLNILNASESKSGLIDLQVIDSPDKNSSNNNLNSSMLSKKGSFYDKEDQQKIRKYLIKVLQKNQKPNLSKNNHEGTNSRHQLSIEDQTSSQSSLLNQSQNQLIIKNKQDPQNQNYSRKIKDINKIQVENRNNMQHEDGQEQSRSTSPDQLKNEHSNSVQEPLLKNEIDFNGSFYSKQNANMGNQDLNNGDQQYQQQNAAVVRGRNGVSNFNRKMMQFHTQNNFYSGGGVGVNNINVNGTMGIANNNNQTTLKNKQSKFKNVDQQILQQKSQKQYLENMKTRIKHQYQNTNDQIQEESGEENNIYTEDEANISQQHDNIPSQDDYQMKHQTQQNLNSYIKSQTTNDIDVSPSSQQIIINRKKHQKLNNNINDGVTPKSKFIKQSEQQQQLQYGNNMNNCNNNQYQHSPGNPVNAYQGNINTNIGITINHNSVSNGGIGPLGGFSSNFLEKQKLNQLKHVENSYTDNSHNNNIFDRSTTNRTPLLEYYQNQSNSLTRNQNLALKSNSQNTATTSVPRPTIASELKLLKEQSKSHHQQNQEFGKKVSDQFLHNNNLANFMWNKDATNQSMIVQNDRASLSKQGSRIRGEYNIHDGISQSSVRPITRSNQRRPVSRQVNQTVDSGINAQKLIVQQQMRNTHFGDGGGFGFGAKSRVGDISLDSDRKLSRKRGTKLPANGKQDQRVMQDEQQLRESMQRQILKKQNENSTLNNIQQLNRSITFNNQSQSHNNNNLIKQNTISTQDSTGQHFYQPNNFLNKSIESSSSRSIMIQSKLQNQSTLYQINENINDDMQIITDSNPQSNGLRSKNKILSSMGGTQYGDNNAFKNFQQQQQISPQKHLQPIEENLQTKIVIGGAQNTRSKFYVQTNVNNANKIQLPLKNSRNIQLQQKQEINDAHSNYDNGYGPMRSYNNTQEKFFPQRNQSNSSKNYHQKQEKSQNDCSTSIDLNNGTSGQLKELQQQQSFTQKNLIKKQNKQNRFNNDMIREEQQEEVSEDDMHQVRRGNVDVIVQQNTLKSANQVVFAQTQANLQNVERPTNRLGGSRVFNQTRENWKDQVNEYSSSAQTQNQNNSYMNNTSSGNHSLPRNTNNYAYQNYNDLVNDSTSQKTTSSASSLTISKQNMPSTQASNQNSIITNSNNHISSISPKPFNNKQTLKDSSQGVGVGAPQTAILNHSQLNNSKLHELQKEVNLMYLGGLSQKKKVGAGIKLNPISRNINIQGKNSQTDSSISQHVVGSNDLQKYDQDYLL